MVREKIGAGGRFGASLHCAMFRFVWAHGNNAVAGLFEHRDHLLAAALRQVVREEPPVSDDDAKSYHFIYLSWGRIESSRTLPSRSSGRPTRSRREGPPAPNSPDSTSRRFPRRKSHRRH